MERAINKEELWLHTKQAAEFLGITQGALRHHVARGNIVPDHRARRGGGMQSNQFSLATLRAFRSGQHAHA